MVWLLHTVEANGRNRCDKLIEEHAVEERGLARVADAEEEAAVGGLGVEGAQEGGEFGHCWVGAVYETFTASSTVIGGGFHILE